MKKQLLSNMLFLLTITFVSAQTEISFEQTGSNNQIFTVGQQDSDNLNDPSIVAVSGSGIVISNNSFFGISGPDLIDQTAAGTFTFTVTTNSASAITTSLDLDMAKRPGCSVSGKVSVTGYDDTSFSFDSNGTDVSAVQPLNIQFGSLISLISGSSLTVTIALESMQNIDNAHTPIFRLENVLLEKDGSLGVQDNNLVSSIGLFPNPATDTFNINANDAINNVSVYSLNGQLVKSFTENESYDISNLATGLYSVRVSTTTGSKTIKLIKN